MRSSRLLLLSILFISLLSACQPTNIPLVKPADEVKTVAEDVSTQEAISQYLALANKSSGEKQAIYFLRAAGLQWDLGDITSADATLNKVDRSILTGENLQKSFMLGADIAASQQDAETVLTLIEQMDFNQLSITGQKKVLTMKADAYTVTQNWLGKVEALLELNIYLDAAEVLGHQAKLWSALMEMTPEALDLYNPGFPPQENSGWFALAYLIKAYQAHPETLQVALEDWLRSYPFHPADPSLYEDILNAGTRLPDDLEHIAVLLPNSGPFAKAAEVIKQGIIAAHYASGNATQLHFLDVHNENGGYSDVIRQYDAAESMGASIVIGPLQKQSVDELSTYSDLPIPVLALNRIDERLSRPNLYQFGLAPEDDVQTIVNAAIEQGFQRAVVLAPNNTWGERIASAFNKAWQAQEGVVISESRYDENAHDFKVTLEPLMGLSRSEQRYQTIKSLLGEKPEFEPRRRQDIDFLFLVAKPNKARQLVPQIKFHRSGTLPLYATSHAYTGKQDTQQDIDLNALTITDIPWMFNDGNTDLAALGFNDAGAFARLYAMGVDAYRLIPELNQLSRDSLIVMPGATGKLSINEIGQVTRITPMGKFKQGRLEPIK
jgi:hypothetical protein